MGHSEHCGHHKCVISLSRATVFGICCCCLQLWITVRAAPVEDEIYADIAKSLDAGAIRVDPDLQTFIDKIFERLQCGNPDNSRGCLSGKCLNASTAFQYAGYLPGTEVLTPKTFLGVSLPILYYASRLREYCDDKWNIIVPCVSTDLGKDRLACWIQYLFTNSSSVSEGEVDLLLQRISVGYVPQLQNVSEEVLRASSMFRKDLKVPPKRPLSKDKLSLLSAIVLKGLFHGVPVATTGSNVPHVRPTPLAPLEALYPDDFLDFIADVGPGQEVSVDRLADIMNKLKIGNLSSTTFVVRSGAVSELSPSHTTAKRQTVDSDFLLNESCLPMEVLLSLHGVHDEVLTKLEFQNLCPALVQQAYTGACSGDRPRTAVIQQSAITDAEKYGYGTVSVVLISLLSVLGIVFLPFLEKRIYAYALQGFIALGVGTLCGDALLHLLPEALSVHEEHDSNENKTDDHVILWRCVACLGAIYVFFLWEVSLHYFISHRKQKTVRLQHHQEDGRASSNGHEKNDHSHIPDPEQFTRAMKKNPADLIDDKDIELSNKHKSSNQDHSHDENQEKFLGLSPLAWMILLGDAIHNFGDGLTIAAAFSVDVRSGISTSIAIFCHEIPHELGDFAILLSTGMPFRKALILNVITALTCLVGFYAGVPIASYESARQWIFVIAAGMFLYVALADMLPELKHGAGNLLTLVLQNLGLIVGVGIMILMAYFEDDIKI